MVKLFCAEQLQYKQTTSRFQIPHDTILSMTYLYKQKSLYNSEEIRIWDNHYELPCEKSEGGQIFPEAFPWCLPMHEGKPQGRDEEPTKADFFMSNPIR